jgi:hypothetical protein
MGVYYGHVITFDYGKISACFQFDSRDKLWDSP